MRWPWSAVSGLWVLAAWPGAVAAQTGFNGVITFANDRSSAKQDTFVQYSKGRKVRFDGFGSSHGSMIVDNEARLIMVVDPEKKQYITMTEDDMKQMQAMLGPMMERMRQQRAKQTPTGRVSFRKTGKTQRIAGVPCEVYHGEYVDDDGSKDEGEACVASGVGFALDALTFNNPMIQHGNDEAERLEQFRELVGGGKGILSAKSFRDGKPKTDMQAIKIDRQAVPDSLFAPPAGYKEIRMRDMMMKAQGAMRPPPGAKPGQQEQHDSE